ncbi:hypothetical protein CEXT_521911 [Caerostris extrusa]|uniref:Uncharacterized protein n=1 Tax=Caerostris extrusa TaxID=172846 RepID=A0AAV4SJY2_CAEEX|nr:hypothetical protein CEXT_521911 [Caerostris extrusa]
MEAPMGVAPAHESIRWAAVTRALLCIPRDCVMGRGKRGAARKCMCCCWASGGLVHTELPFLVLARLESRLCGGDKQ